MLTRCSPRTHAGILYGGRSTSSGSTLRSIGSGHAGQRYDSMTAGTGASVTTALRRRSDPGRCSLSMRSGTAITFISGTPSLPQTVIKSGIDTAITEDAPLRRIPGIRSRTRTGNGTQKTAPEVGGPARTCDSAAPPRNGPAPGSLLRLPVSALVVSPNPQVAPRKTTSPSLQPFLPAK